jgi:hypothetical protein
LRHFYSVFIACFLTLINGAVVLADQAGESLNYGQLYVAESSLRKELPWKFGANLGSQIGNSYESVLTGTFSAERFLGKFFWIGLQGTLYSSSPSSLMTAVSQDLSSQAIQVRLVSPKSSAYSILTWIPLSGYLSWFGNHPLEIHLGVRAGAGLVAYDRLANKFSTLWSLRPGIHFTPRWSLQLAVVQEIESPFDSKDQVNRFRGELGVGFQL